jgi:hypothetical protein
VALETIFKEAIKFFEEQKQEGEEFSCVSFQRPRDLVDDVKSVGATLNLKTLGLGPQRIVTFVEKVREKTLFSFDGKDVVLLQMPSGKMEVMFRKDLERVESQPGAVYFVKVPVEVRSDQPGMLLCHVGKAEGRREKRVPEGKTASGADRYSVNFYESDPRVACLARFSQKMREWEQVGGELNLPSSSRDMSALQDFENICCVLERRKGARDVKTAEKFLRHLFGTPLEWRHGLEALPGYTEFVLVHHHVFDIVRGQSKNEVAENGV